MPKLTLGVDLSDLFARVVVVNDNGAVLARGQMPPATGNTADALRDTANYVGMAVANLATILDPEVIVLGGTIAASGDLMLEAIRLECSRRLRPAQTERVRIVLSTLGVDAVAIGAARAAARAVA